MSILTRAFRRHAGPLLIGIFLLSCLAEQAIAQLPTVRLFAVYPAAAQPGQQLDVEVQGADLDDVNRLQFSHAGITTQQKMREPGPFETGPQPVPNQFVVKVANNVPPGNHDVRVIGKYGISNPRVFLVDSLATLIEQQDNNLADQAQPLQLPVAVFGRLDKTADVDYYASQATPRQRLIVRCQARSIDSRMVPVVVVLNSEGRVLGNSRSTRENEPLVDFLTPADGKFIIKVYDATYRGGPDFFYRLSVGNLPHIDFIYPPTGQAGGTRQFTLYGRNLPSGQPSGLRIEGVEFQQLDVKIPIPATPQRYAPPSRVAIDSVSAGMDLTSFQLEGAVAHSNTVLVGISDLPPTLETEPNNQASGAQPLVLPVELAGRFQGRADYDWYTFNAKQGDQLVVEIFCERHHTLADTRLIIQQVTQEATEKEEEQVKLVAAVNGGSTPLAGFFDARTSAPVYRLDVPADGTYRVLVTDGLNMLRDDPRQTYRLVIRPRTADFRVVAVPEHGHPGLLLRKGGQLALQLVAYRHHGFNEAIRVKATNLPAGITANEVTIGPGMTSTLMQLRCADNVAPTTGQFSLIAEATEEGKAISRPGRFAVVNWQGTAQNGNNAGNIPVSRLASALTIAISETETAVVGLDLGNGSLVEASRAADVKIPYKRRGAFKGKMTLTAVGLPPNATAKQLVINANADNGEMLLQLKANTPPGTFTLYLRGTAEKVKYSRNPEAVTVAQEKKKKVDQLKAEADAAATAATAAKTATDKMATDAATAKKAAEQKMTASGKALVDAQAAAKVTTATAAKAKATSLAKPEDATLKTAAATAQKVATDSTTKVTTAMTAVAAATKELAENISRAAKADEAKELADKKAVEATTLAKAAAILKTATDKLVTDRTNAAKAKDLTIALVSSPFTIKVAPAPITLAAPQANLIVKQGEQVTLPVKITRLFAFAEQVTVAGVVPTGVGGLSIPNVNIAKGQDQASLAITAAANATAGTHQLTLRLTLKLNNQNLIVDQPLPLVVQEVKKTK